MIILLCIVVQIYDYSIYKETHFGKNNAGKMQLMIHNFS